VLARLTNFPILLLIAWYERSRKASDASNFYDTITAAIERLYDSLPKGIKRQMCKYLVLQIVMLFFADRSEFAKHSSRVLLAQKMRSMQYLKLQKGRRMTPLKLKQQRWRTLPLRRHHSGTCYAPLHRLSATLAHMGAKLQTKVQALLRQPSQCQMFAAESTPYLRVALMSHKVSQALLPRYSSLL